MNMRMTSSAAAVLAAVVLGASMGFAQIEIRKEPVRFKAGESTAAIKGMLKGDETVDYILNARAGQSMVVNLECKNKSAYFNVLPPGSDSAIFIGSTLGNKFEGELPAPGDYTVRVYLMRSAARRGEAAPYTITFGLSSPAPRLELDNSPITRQTGGMRPIQGRLAKGEASCILRADEVVEY